MLGSELKVHSSTAGEWWRERMNSSLYISDHGYAFGALPLQDGKLSLCPSQESF